MEIGYPGVSRCEYDSSAGKVIFPKRERTPVVNDAHLLLGMVDSDLCSWYNFANLCFVNQ